MNVRQQKQCSECLIAHRSKQAHNCKRAGLLSGFICWKCHGIIHNQLGMKRIAARKQFLDRIVTVHDNLASTFDPETK